MKFYRNVFQSSASEITHHYVENSIRKTEVVKFQPIRGYSTNKETEWKDIYGNNLITTRFESIPECNKWEQENKEIIDVYGSINHSVAFIAETYPEGITFDKSKFNIYSLDIECYSSGGFPKAENPDNYITAVTFLNFNTKQYYTFSLKNFKSDDVNHHYYKCVSEENLLINVIDFVNRMEIDIITGWNLSFDIPYMIIRTTMLLGEDYAKRFSPNRKIKKESKIVNKRETVDYSIMGIIILDYLELYKKFVFDNRENYTLKYISTYELGDTKIEYAGDLNSLYDNDFDLFIQYNKKDVELIQLLDNKLKFIDIAIAYSFDMKCTLDNIFGTVVPWDSLLYCRLYHKSILVPPNKSAISEHYEGGFVKEPIKGMHYWVSIDDITSSYPNNCIQSNISSETIINDISKYPELIDIQHRYTGIDICADINNISEITNILKKYNVTFTANGQFFKRDKQGFIPEIVEEIFNGRMEIKKKIKKLKIERDKSSYPVEFTNEIDYLENLSLIMKIKINSNYGFLASQYSRYYDLRLAAAITNQGQVCIKGAGKYLTEKYPDINLIYIDTDSLQYSLSTVVEKRFGTKLPDTETVTKFILKYHEKIIRPTLHEYFNKMSITLNTFKSTINMEHECIANKAIFLEKKKYVMSQIYKEGEWYLDKPKYKIKGIEIVRTSTPQVVRDSLRKTIDIIFTTDNNTIIEFIDKFKKQFYKMSFEQIASPRGVKFSKYTIDSKGLPIQVRTSFVFNEALKKLNLTEKYKQIGDGSKIKFCYIKTPNMFNSDAIACLDKFPVEILEKIKIDYDTQWQKVFRNPLEKILNTIGWVFEENNRSMASFFD